MSLTMSFQQAVRLAVKNDNRIERDIIPQKWATTYGVSLEQVRTEFERAQSEASLAPANVCEEPDL